MRDLTAALDLLDLAVASSDGLATDRNRESAAGVASAARRRQDYFSGSILVAIAGGTGSGKSSLLNAIAGSEIAATSALRPHTDAALAWIPHDDHAIAAMVADLGITHIVEQEDDSPLAIIDLPDLDSVDGQHRTLVESVLPHVDAVLWVFDPIKYHDPSIHADFLTHMTAYESVFTFVLNKVDRLDEAEAEAVATHLGGILEMDGLSDPQIVTVAANPPDGEPINIEGLVTSLNDTLVAKRADRAKLIEDLQTTQTAGGDLLPETTILNVNYPPVSPDELQGVRVLQASWDVGVRIAYEETEEPGKLAVRMQLLDAGAPDDGDDDWQWLSRGYATISVLDGNTGVGTSLGDAIRDDLVTN